jgi:anti-sigma factor RsiW
MFCADFEDRLTDYLDGALDAATQRAFGEHALRCPVCHELLGEVKNSIAECRASAPPAPSFELEARILRQTVPESEMTCEQFEEHLTDYLDGFLPAPLFHRWERHAALCESCTELPGQVVRAIGACYSYISEERPLPAGLHERILQETLGTTRAAQVRAPLPARIGAAVRGWLDLVVSPQLATVSAMALMAVMVGTTTISDDGSISGMYRASLRLAAQTYQTGARTAEEAAGSDDVRRVKEGFENLVGDPQSGAAKVGQTPQPQAQPSQPDGSQPKPKDEEQNR